jgi:hypothetical protein
VITRSSLGTRRRCTCDLVATAPGRAIAAQGR